MYVFWYKLQLQLQSQGAANGMIYEPRLAFDLRAALISGVIQAIVLAIGDFISQDNKPWAYYTGAALGYTAAATGIPNAAATMYVVGELVDITLFHSPDGSDVQLFLDGVLIATADTYVASGSNWTAVGMAMAAGVLHRIDIVNAPSTNGDKTSDINWLGIGAVEVTGDDARILRTAHMSYITINFRVADSEGGRNATYPHRIASGATLAEIQDEVDAFAELLDNVTAGQIVGVDVEVPMDLPAGLKATPNALSVNERGGLISFSTTGPRADSVWIPAVLPSLAPGEGEFDVTAGAMDLFADKVIADARTVQDYAFLARKKGVRSLRK